MKRALFILGMHRSGTSALARVVNLLGADLGTRLMAAAEDNQKGFFEHELIVQIHEQLLTELGMSWKDSTPLPEDWLKSEAAQKAQAAIAEILDTEFADSELWALKDPRQCRLMPLWIPLLEERGIEPSFIIAYRHPLEVAASLAKRRDMEEAPALHCWLSYTLEALSSALNYPHSIISYNALMDDWQSAMRKVGHNLKLDWPVSIEEAESEIETFLSPELRHHQFDKTDLPKPVLDCLKLLQKPSKTKADKQLQKLHEAANPYGSLLQESRLESFTLHNQLDEQKKHTARAEHRVNDLEKETAILKEKVEVTLKEKLQKAYDELEATQREATRREALLKDQLEQIYASTSWKVTGPLRKIRGLSGGAKELEKPDNPQ